MSHFETFFRLHQQNYPFILANSWDVVSAKTFEANGFSAIATSSAALARSMGYEDGQEMPFDLLVIIASRISGSIHIPFSVDMERGYGRDLPEIFQNLERLHEIGVVGFNIEDSFQAQSRQLMTVDGFRKIISAIRNHLDQKNMHMFINARTDGFLLGHRSALEETYSRIKAYEQAGATGIFVPGISALADIERLVKSTSLPLNVLCAADLPSFDQLAHVGVKRISLGSSFHRATTRQMESMMQKLQKDHACQCLF
jgi:2-methylisocitrate lyase-like PEP mutase family enzyme